MALIRIQLGLIHVAVAMTLVPINSTLNRVMNLELGLSATLVAILASLPYFFCPLQVAVGALSDRHPWSGLQLYDGMYVLSRVHNVKFPATPTGADLAGDRFGLRGGLWCSQGRLTEGPF